jgi:hypothetical protein
VYINKVVMPFFGDPIDLVYVGVACQRGSRQFRRSS